MDDRTFYARVLDLLKQGQPLVIAHLIGCRGSAPNAPGSRLIVRADGHTEFTIGGGPFEAAVIRDALTILRGDLCSAVKEYDLNYRSLGMRCGGRVQVYFEVVYPRTPLWIFGAGHIGQALCTLAAQTRLFEITVIDDRPEWLDRLPKTADVRAICTDRAYTAHIPPPPSSAYIVIVTRCHDVDAKVLRRMIGYDVAYIGMIGSRTKVRSTFQALVRAGVPRTRLEAVDAPIGVPIGGKSPYEVAVSILARLIQVRNGVFPRFSERVADPTVVSDRASEAVGP